MILSWSRRASNDPIGYPWDDWECPGFHILELYPTGSPETHALFPDRPGCPAICRGTLAECQEFAQTLVSRITTLKGASKCPGV